MPVLGHQVFCRVPEQQAISIVDALSLFNNWSVEIPPTGPTGDMVTDRLLSADFNTLASLNGTAARFAWLEAELEISRDRNSDFPAPDGPMRNATLIRWWLEIFNHMSAATHA